MYTIIFLLEILVHEPYTKHQKEDASSAKESAVLAKKLFVHLILGPGTHSSMASWSWAESDGED